MNAFNYISSAKGRLKGYKKVLKINNIKFDKKLVCEINIAKVGNCCKNIKELLKDGIKFSGVFAFSDLIAWEAIYFLQELGLRIPDDISIVGFDNIQSRLFYPYPLTTINYRKRKIAEKVVKILIERLKSNKLLKPVNEVIKVNLIERNSS